MKKLSIVFLAALAAACNNAASTGTQTANSNAADRPMRSEQMQQNSVAHTTENQPPPNPNAPGKFAQGGEAIDTAKFDGVIAEAEKALKSKPNDAAAKTALADAYFDRALALTDSSARQYAAALGDYRRALKLNPNHEQAREWRDRIVAIFKEVGKEPPKEGEEPPPLPFKKS